MPHASFRLFDAPPRPAPEGLAQPAAGADTRTCSDAFALVLVAALAYPLARQVSGALVYLCAATILLGLPLTVTFVSRIKFFTLGFLILAMALEATTAVMHAVTNGNPDWIKYSFIGFVIWFVMAMGNVGVHHRGRVRLDTLIVGAAIFYILVMVLVQRQGGCPSGSVCVTAAQFDQGDREQSIFEHPNELGLYVTGLMAFLAWIFRDKSLQQKLFGAVLGAALLVFLIRSDSATSFVVAAAVVASCYSKPLRPLINLGVAGVIFALFVLQVFAPDVGMRISGFQGSFWWRFVVADEVGRAIGHDLLPVRDDLFNVFNTWLHSKYMDIYVMFGRPGVTAFAVGAVVAILSNARSLSATVLGAVVISSLVQPFGAFPGPFLLWAIMYACMLSDEYRSSRHPAASGEGR